MTTTRAIVASSLVAAAMGSPSLALAEDTFQAEAGLSYSRFKADDVRANAAGAEATYFFDKLPTQPKDYPLEQAQFVERSSSLGANYSRSSADIPGQERLSDGWLYGVNADFRRPDSPLILSAGYQSAYSGKTRDPSASIDSEVDTRFYQASVGAYVAKTTALALDWSSRTSDIKSSGSPTTTDRSTSIGISGEHLARFSKGDHIAVVVSVRQDRLEPVGAESEKNRDYLLQATYYPTKRLGLKLGVESNRGDDRFSEGETYLAGVKIFVIPTISLSLDYQRFQAKAPDNDRNFLMLAASMRF